MNFMFVLYMILNMDFVFVLYVMFNMNLMFVLYMLFSKDFMFVLYRINFFGRSNCLKDRHIPGIYIYAYLQHLMTSFDSAARMRAASTGAQEVRAPVSDR